MTRKKPREDWIARDLPVVAELKQCRRLAKDHWQGVDVDGTVLDIIEAEEGLSPAKLPPPDEFRNSPRWASYPIRGGWAWAPTVS